MITAIVLSAGASFRMGSQKAVLQIREKTFLRHIVDVIQSAGVEDVVIVLGADAEIIQQSLQWFNGKILVNLQWRNGQLSSIIAGLNEIHRADVEGTLICPVDHPLISQKLLLELLETFQKHKTKIVVPVYQGRRGHPIIFPSTMF